MNQRAVIGRYSFGSLVVTPEFLPKYRYRGDVPIPETFNHWVEAGYCMNAMNQKQCGGCWSFAINGVLADKYNILYNKQFNQWLSPQFLIACDQNAYNFGCQGSSDVESAASDLQAKGTFLYKDYPFDSSQSGGTTDCQMPTNGLRFRTVNSRRIADTSKDYTLIKEAIMSEGPVVTTFAVMNDFVQQAKSTFFNKGGIYGYDGQSQFVGGHAVMIVGWGKDNTNKLYWILKNSWDVTWGNKGYFYAYADQLPFTNQQGQMQQIGFSQNCIIFEADQTGEPADLITEIGQMGIDQSATYKTLGLPVGQNVSSLVLPPGVQPPNNPPSPPNNPPQPPNNPPSPPNNPPSPNKPSPLVPEVYFDYNKFIIALLVLLMLILIILTL